VNPIKLKSYNGQLTRSNRKRMQQNEVGESFRSDITRTIIIGGIK